MNDPHAPRLTDGQHRALRDLVDRLDRRVRPFDRPGFVSFVGDSRSLLKRRGVEWTDALREDLLTMSMRLAFGGRFHDGEAEDRVRASGIFEPRPVDPFDNVPADLISRPEPPTARGLKAMIRHELIEGDAAGRFAVRTERKVPHPMLGALQFTPLAYPTVRITFDCLPTFAGNAAMILHETETGLVLDPEHLVEGAGLHHVATADDVRAQLLAPWPALLTLIGEWVGALYAAGPERSGEATER